MINQFPKQFKPYDHQIPVLEQLEDAIKSNTKYIILQAPTGSGKSLFAATIANASQAPSSKIIEYADNQKFYEKDKYGGYTFAEDILDEPYFGSYTLTVSKQLQNQYTQLFKEECDILKGKTNYVCKIDDQFNCEIAPCVLSTKQFRSCQTQKICSYFNARDSVLKSKFGILNYSMFLCLPDHCKRREFLICDEASELEDELVKYYSVSIDYHELSKYYNLNIKKLLIEDREPARLWLTDLYQIISSKITEIEQLVKNKGGYLNKKHISELNKIKNLSRLNERIRLTLSYWHSSEYVVERVDGGVEFSPLYVNNLSLNIFDHAKHVILMSATIIDHKTFAKSLGIKDYKYIEASSVFDPDKSPIYCPGKYLLNFANINKNLNKVAIQAKEICDLHKNEKGIVHTHSFKITEAIQRAVKNESRFLFREQGINNEMILKEHFSNDSNSVIVSPSLGFGTDLIGDHGRFQIIMKLPYMPLGSKRIKILAKKDFRWYNMKMLISLIQMSGRCTRSKDDEAKTYILDGMTVKILKTNWDKLPLWFRTRLH